MKPLLIIILLTAIISAAPAFEHNRTFTQPDGSTFTGTFKGDEYLHWIETANGEILVYDKASKQYEEAVITSETLKGSGRIYRAEERVKRARAFRSPQQQRDALHQLWLKKRQQEMRRRSGFKN